MADKLGGTAVGVAVGNGVTLRVGVGLWVGVGVTVTKPVGRSVGVGL